MCDGGAGSGEGRPPRLSPMVVAGLGVAEK